MEQKQAGRVKSDLASKTLKEYFQSWTPEGSTETAAEKACSTLIKAMDDRDDGKVTSQAIKASEIVMAYVWGKPKESVSHDGVVRVVREDAGPTWDDRHAAITQRSKARQ